MKKRFVQVVMLTLALAVCLGSAAQAASGTAIDQTLVRIGLSYGSATVVSGTLTNSTGSGFRLGYFDSSNAFVSLMETGETAISALKTHNLYLTSSGSYSTTDAGKGAVGCYHVQLPGSYADGAAAAAAALAVSDGFPAWVGGTGPASFAKLQAYYQLNPDKFPAAAYCFKSDAFAVEALRGMLEPLGYTYTETEKGFLFTAP